MPASRSAQTFVRGRGHKISDPNRSRMDTGRHQTGNVSNVHEKIGTHQVRDFPHLLEINHPRIGRGSGGDHPGTMRFRHGREKIIINSLRLPVYTVMGDLVKST